MAAPELVVLEGGREPPRSGPVLRGWSGAANILAVSTARSRELRLRDLVTRYIDFVARVLRNSGTPEAEVDDAVQRTFISVSNRLDDVRPGAERSFLLQTALHTAAHARRSMARRREVHSEDLPEMADGLATPEQLTDQKLARRLLDGVLERMSQDLRTVFVLYEFEELSSAEIAEALNIPRGTVASRLRRARIEFRGGVLALEGFGKVEVGS
jgi:RNA polymerase sigma-70 factor, ECF subfamily